MAYLLVFAAALAVGLIVYWLNLRQEQGGAAAPPEGGTFGPPAAGAPPPPPGSTYVPLPSASRTWEQRVGSLLGIVVTIALTAAAIAMVLYLGGSALWRLFYNAANNGGVGPGPTG